MSATLLLSCADSRRNNKVADDSTHAINVGKVSGRQLRYLHYANGGLLGFYSDGTVVGCPRCDLVRENIDAMVIDTPMSRYNIASDGSLLINGSNQFNPRSSDDAWAMIDFKWLVDIDYISGNEFNWIDTFVYTDKGERGLDGIYIQTKETLAIFYSTPADSLLSWAYSVHARQTYYLIEGYVVRQGDVLDCYATRLSDGVYRYGFKKINKNEPFFRLRYYRGQIQTQWLQPTSQKTFHVYFRQKSI